MGRTLHIALPVLLLAAACGGGDSDGQPQTEAGAVEATVNAMEGTLQGDIDAILDFMTEECRADTDREELMFGLMLLRGFLESDDFDLDDVEVVGEIAEFDGDTASVSVSYELPDGADVEGLSFDEDDVDVVYDHGRWVAVDCDTGSSSDTDFGSNDDEDLEEELAALGLTGTKDDPLPPGTAAPIGGGFEIVFTSWDPDVVERYNTANDTQYLLDDGEQMALVEYTLVYRGTAEPKALGDARVDLVGSDSVELNTIGCDALGNDAFFSNRQMFSGGTFAGAACFTGDATQIEGSVIAASGDWFQDRLVFFDPAADPGSIDSIAGSTGPAPDGEATEARTNPAPLGTPIELDESWTVQVNSFDPDVTDEILANDTFADPPPAGQAYAAVNVTYTYTGENSSGVYAVPSGLIGDSNVGADDCGFASPPNEIDGFTDLFNGGSVTGNQCFLIDTADADSTVMWFRSNASFDDDLTFAALR